jgi:hypothetical protein
MKTLEQIKLEAFNDELKKIAFSGGERTSGTFKQKINVIKRHPTSFAKHIIAGEGLGALGGAVGGGVVMAPIAAAMALKSGKGNFIRSFKKDMALGMKAEAVGGAIAGIGFGGNRFFKKYKYENKKGTI